MILGKIQIGIKIILKLDQIIMCSICLILTSNIIEEIHKFLFSIQCLIVNKAYTMMNRIKKKIKMH